MKVDGPNYTLCVPYVHIPALFIQGEGCPDANTAKPVELKSFGSEENTAPKVSMVPVFRYWVGTSLSERRGVATRPHDKAWAFRGTDDVAFGPSMEPESS